MTSTLSHIAVGIAVITIFFGGCFVFRPRVTLLINLSTSIGLSMAAALLVTAARAFG